MNLRHLILLAAALLGAAAPAAVAAKEGDLSIVHVYTGWRDAASFKRISEYFDGKENTRGEAVLRSQPDQRAGFYFLVRVKSSAGPRALKATLHIVTATNTRPADYSFPIELKAGETVVHLGLTGSDWSNPNGHPVAWKLELKDAADHLVAAESSYLWEKPAAP